MNAPHPVTLEGHGVRLEPLTLEHHDALAAAAADGRLWELWFTSVPEPGQTRPYILEALAGRDAGHMLPWAVRDLATGAIAGSTRYHDIVPAADRVEIGYTWYGARWQRSDVNTACKLLLFEHAFESLGCQVVGLRTDNFNVRSQRAIEALGAKQDGVIRHHQARRDGTVRDTVMYSVLAAEWPDVRRRLELRLARGTETRAVRGPDARSLDGRKSLHVSHVFLRQGDAPPEAGQDNIVTNEALPQTGRSRRQGPQHARRSEAGPR